MPHNKTRLWVGLAIIAVTIPAVGTYYARLTDNGPYTPIVAANRYGTTAPQAQTVAARTQARDYAAEVDALLAKQASSPTRVGLQAPPGQEEYLDDQLDIDPLPSTDDGLPDALPPDPSVGSSSADPTTLAATSATTDSETSGQAPMANVPTAPVDPGDNLSNADVYRIVVNNLNDQDRERFAQAYSAMTTQQRADLIDSFRDQMQNGNGQ